MKFNLFLHKEIAYALMCFGDLDTVINKVLRACVTNEIDVMDKPVCPHKNGCEHYVVNITEPHYIELYNIYGPRSSRISLRRLLYWFVENEIYEEFNWTPISKLVHNKSLEKFNKKIAAAVEQLRLAISYSSSTSIKNTLNELINQLMELNG